MSRCARIASIALAVVGTQACSNLGSVCTNVMVTRQPSAIVFPTVIASPAPAPAYTGPPPPRLGDNENDDAWAVVVEHVDRSSGGRFTMVTRPGPPGYVPPAHPRGSLVTLADATTLVSFGYAVESYTGPIELVVPSRAVDGAIKPVTVKGRVTGMTSVGALVDLRNRRVVQFLPPVLGGFAAEDRQLYDSLATVDRVCTRRRSD